jgi:hypothetical protein
VIRLEPNLELGLTTLSKVQGLSKAELTRQLIKDRIAQHQERKSPFEIAQELGVIGVDTDPRTDAAEKHSRYVKEKLRAKRPA